MNGRLSKLLILAVILTVGSISTITLVPMMTSKTNEKTVAMIDKVGSTEKAPSTSVQSVIRSTGTRAQSGTVPGVSMGADPNAYYTDMPSIQGDKSSFTETGGFKVYTKPPWDSTKKTFFFNGIKAKDDLWEYLVTHGANKSATQGSKDFTMNNSFAIDVHSLTSNARGGSGGASGTKSCGAYYMTVDGIDCCYVCCLSALVYRDYISAGTWGKYTYVGGNRPAECSTMKLCVVMTKKGNDLNDQSKWEYLPAVIGDTKNHTYPWGVTQTNVHVESSTKLFGAGPSDFSKPFTVSNAGTDEAVEKIAKNYKYGGCNILSYLYGTVEFVGVNHGSILTDFKNKYTYVGFLVYL